MDCFTCKVKMAEGMVSNNVWTEGLVGEINKKATWTIGLGKKVIAFRCSKCGKVEFYTEEKEL